MTEKVTHLLPGFFQKLHSANLCYDFCNFINLVCNNKFPLTNIALLLFLDAVRWYGLPITSMMTYKEDTMKFWRVVYRLFHGKVFRFMFGVIIVNKYKAQYLLKQCQIMASYWITMVDKCTNGFKAILQCTLNIFGFQFIYLNIWRK